MKAIKPIHVFNPSLLYVGSIWTHSSGTKMQVVSYEDKFHVRVKFLDETGYECVANIDNIKNGSVKNPYMKLKHGGYFGEGNIIASHNMNIYKTWDSMLVRTSSFSKNPSYSNTSVCQEWFCFQTFANWYINYINHLNPKFNYHLDKDIFQWNFQSKVYSPGTCCLIPDTLNMALVGMHVERHNHSELPVGVMPNSNKFSSYITLEDKRVYLGNFETPMEAFNAYKIEKEKRIKELADFYFS